MQWSEAKKEKKFTVPTPPMLYKGFPAHTYYSSCEVSIASNNVYAGCLGFKPSQTA